MPDSGRRPPAPAVHPDEEKHGFGRKLMGLFVETDHKDAAAPVDEPGAPMTAAEEVAALARSAGPAVSVPPAPVPAPPPPPPAPGDRPVPPGNYKTPDFSGIFKSAGMSDEDRDRLAKAEEFLRNLPAETPAALKRQIVEGTLRTFGIPIEKLSASAVRAAEALDTYLGISEQDLQQRLDAAQKRLRELQIEQEKLQATLAERRQYQSTLVFDVRARQSELRGVTTFFGLPPVAPPSRTPAPSAKK